MCTTNQEKTKSGKKAYKVCEITPSKKSVLSLYARSKWKLGENKSKLNNKWGKLNNKWGNMYIDYSQIGFHCFTRKIDAINFAKKILSESGYYSSSRSRRQLVVITVTLHSSKKPLKNLPNIPLYVRKGINSINWPVYDASPVLVAPIAQWDGNYEIIEKY